MENFSREAVSLSTLIGGYLGLWKTYGKESPEISLFFGICSDLRIISEYVGIGI